MRACLVICAVLGAACPAPGYIHVPPTTLKGVCKGAPWIRILTVKACDKEKGRVTFEVSEALLDNPKWKSGVVSFRLSVPADAPGAKSVLDQLEVGKNVVMFSNEGEGKNASGFGYVCFGKGWYSVDYNPKGELLLLLRSEPDLSRCYHGDIKDLPGFVKSVLAGKDVKAPTAEPTEKVDHSERAKQIDNAMKKNRGEK